MEPLENSEERFIRYLSQHFSTKDPLVGIGDDCAVIPQDQTKAWLVTTDALVEGVHFLKEEITPTDLGYKTVAVNVSDISAMGGKPLYAFLSIALPKTIDWAFAHDIMEGIKTACTKWNILLLGGDTVGSKRDLFLNLTLIGSATIDQIKYRHLAQPGDLICVTGYLGNAGGGLQALQEKAPHTKEIADLLHAHFHPEPCPEQGAFLSLYPEVHAMMDVSDGLHCDLTRLIQRSQLVVSPKSPSSSECVKAPGLRLSKREVVLFDTNPLLDNSIAGAFTRSDGVRDFWERPLGATIEISKIPLSESLARTSKKRKWDALELALTGGEDYCLLCTISPEGFPILQDAFQKQFNIPLFHIGKVTSENPGKIVYELEGKIIQKQHKNFDHFG